MTYWMYDAAGRGDSGPLSEAWGLEDERAVLKGDRPQLGCSMRVGSPYARSYSAQDYWTTTPVVEIVKDEPDHVQFRTRSGTIYDWKII